MTSARRWRLLALPLGAVALAVGVGLGVPHLTKVGWSWPTAVGLIAVGGGLALLVVGGRELWAQGHWAVRFTGVVATVAFLGLTLLTLGQAVAASWVPHVPLGDRRPVDVGLEATTVRFPTDDGVELAAWWDPGADGAAVVLAHGAGTTRTAVLDQAAVLAGHGYGVLLVDARGHGESGGRAMDLGWWGDEDLTAAVDFLVAQPEVDPDRIALLGLSMGGEEALGALGADDRVAAVVAEGATGRVAADHAWLSEVYGWRGAVQERLGAVTTWLADHLSPADPPASLRASVAEAASRPVLLVAAGDVADEGHVADHIRTGAPGSVEVWVVDGADHTGGLRTAPDEWERRVVAFLDEALATGS